MSSKLLEFIFLLITLNDLPMSFLMRPVRHTVIEVGGRVGSDFTFRRIELS